MTTFQAGAGKSTATQSPTDYQPIPYGIASSKFDGASLQSGRFENVMRGIPDVVLSPEEVHAHYALILPAIHGRSDIAWKQPAQGRFGPKKDDAAMVKHFKKLFVNPGEFPGDDRLEGKLTKDTTFEEYSKLFRSLLLEYLQGSWCGFKVRRKISADADEVCLMVRCPHMTPQVMMTAIDIDNNFINKADGTTSKSMPIASYFVGSASMSGAQLEEGRMICSVAELHATNLKMRRPVKPTAYDAVEAALKKKRVVSHGKKMPRPEHEGLLLPMYHPVLPWRVKGEDAPLSALEQADFQRIVITMLSKAFDLEEMQRQQMIVKRGHLIPHDWNKAQDIMEHWGNWNILTHPLPHQGPEGKQEWIDEVKEYFGPDIAFKCSFITNLTRGLTVPAIGDRKSVV